MARRKKKRRKAKKKPKKAKRGPRLGPHGEGVEIDWGERHAGDRGVERLYALGLNDDEIEELIRNPVGKKRDELEKGRPDRIRRWSMAVVKDETRHQLRFVFVVARKKTSTDPGAIIMITGIDLGPV